MAFYFTVTLINLMPVFKLNHRGMDWDTHLHGKGTSVKSLLSDLYEKAGELKHWGLLRMISGMLKKKVEELDSVWIELKLLILFLWIVVIVKCHIFAFHCFAYCVTLDCIGMYSAGLFNHTSYFGHLLTCIFVKLIFIYLTSSCHFLNSLFILVAQSHLVLPHQYFTATWHDVTNEPFLTLHLPNEAAM